jgi:hypothetical protein
MGIKRSGWLLLAMLCLSPAANGGAETCFTPLYYSAMFDAVALQPETGGNPNLKAESDVLTATGKDPHDTGNGCMCGINNGRFDLILRNAQAMGPERIPVSFRLRAVRIAFRDKEGTVSDRTVLIEGSRIDRCLGTPMPLKAYRSFDDPRGQAQTPRILEPGEGIMGCVCLSAPDRSRTGEARIEVAYEPVVPVLDLSAKISAGRSVRHALEGLKKGAFRSFRLSLPDAPDRLKDLRIDLRGDSGLQLYSRRAEDGWSSDLNDWRTGAAAVSAGTAGKTILLLVRSEQADASGTLEIGSGAGSGAGIASTETEASVAQASFIAAGPAAVRVFRAHVLSIGGGAEGEAPLIPVTETAPCCSDA